MTYWPISSPSVFAATKHTNPERTRLSHDGVEHKQPGERHGESDQSPQSRVDDETSTQGKSGVGKKDGAHLQKQSGSEQSAEDDIHGKIISLRVTRSGHMFATLTRSTLTIWQTKPTVVLASVLRSEHSLKTYGPNTDILLRPDSQIFVVQTTLGFLITYSLATDHSSRVYKTQFTNTHGGHSRRTSTISGFKIQRQHDANAGPGESSGLKELSLRFRMVIRVDAGIVRALALDDELVVATEKPTAVQCIRWAPDSTGSQTSTELLSKMAWVGKKATLRDMIHDRPMNLSCWITGEGQAFAVQRIVKREAIASPSLFRGYGFHTPESDADHGVKAAINARFSLLAVGCASGEIYVYTARDYTGNIPLSHKMRPNTSSPGKLNVLAYSPDGYCLFAGYENGWAMWSVYGKPGATSFTTDRTLSVSNGEGWLLGVQEAFWIGGGAELILLSPDDNRLFVLEMARSAITGCFSSANISRSLMQTSTGFMIYRGYDLPDLTTISADVSLWHTVQVPSSYLVDQWPVRSAVISNDGRYVAVAGKRGLAHYSVNSGRWKMFDDPFLENEFTVRGGMCWFQHVLIAAVECHDSHEVRVYSREAALDNSNVMHIQKLPAPIVLITPSGEDSLLVYTYENILYHYIISVADAAVKLIQVGQIALHGIIRAPPRVRALSWILPEDQIHNGDPSQDVAVATILFLVDGKLVLLQPTTTEGGELKYEMRIIAQNVETYALMRDHPAFALDMQPGSLPPSPSIGLAVNDVHGHDLRDSLWFFDGLDMRVWIDMQDVLSSVSAELGRELPTPIKIPVDFYPLSALLNKAIIFGVESELIQRRDTNFAFLRFGTRTHLFLPALLRYHLAQYNHPAALHLSHHYQHLLYFPHALEILLHEILDDEVDTQPPPESALLPSVLSFLSSFPQYLDIVVQCTRKTEVRSWRTLFSNLPPPEDLFEESLQKGNLKTAGGYLLVLHTFEELRSTGDQVVRLLQRAKDEQDWELCKELARFLMALDESGATLRSTLELVELKSPSAEPGFGQSHFTFETSRLNVPPRGRSNGSRAIDFASAESREKRSRENGSVSPSGSSVSPSSTAAHEALGDYFGLGTRK
ncbi:RIC1-domain-containing protein [Cucurbitaria berberidis CBS 394.84]|uniref:RIC1-domain-containing protein n=1 Tax=Cucurbitaria berberidis CBS 394.84 TaxID=1168544 RepID=A0A9P4G8I6_9PLEO|nr:RIC1-domain-containing protein [Cucurbitaria berberidis CBS 394.84]KAF1841007.1 RIC1-domain-containing protein [Cucurbitaria berberidis CBS 394.84]